MTFLLFLSDDSSGNNGNGNGNNNNAAALKRKQRFERFNRPVPQRDLGVGRFTRLQAELIRKDRTPKGRKKKRKAAKTPPAPAESSAAAVEPPADEKKPENPTKKSENAAKKSENTVKKSENVAKRSESAAKKTEAPSKKLENSTKKDDISAKKPVPKPVPSPVPSQRPRRSVRHSAVPVIPKEEERDERDQVQAQVQEEPEPSAEVELKLVEQPVVTVPGKEADSVVVEPETTPEENIDAGKVSDEEIVAKTEPSTSDEPEPAEEASTKCDPDKLDQDRDRDRILAAVKEVMSEMLDKVAKATVVVAKAEELNLSIDDAKNQLSTSLSSASASRKRKRKSDAPTRYLPVTSLALSIKVFRVLHTGSFLNELQRSATVLAQNSLVLFLTARVCCQPWLMYQTEIDIHLY